MTSQLTTSISVLECPMLHTMQPVFSLSNAWRFTTFLLPAKQHVPHVTLSVFRLSNTWWFTTQHWVIHHTLVACKTTSAPCYTKCLKPVQNLVIHHILVARKTTCAPCYTKCQHLVIHPILVASKNSWCAMLHSSSSGFPMPGNSPCWTANKV